MTPDHATPRRPAEKLPDWFPPWAAQLADLYFSGTTAAFVLHGNTYDLFRIGGDDELALRRARRVPGRAAVRPLVARAALRPRAAGCAPSPAATRQRLKEMVALANKKVGDLSALPKDPAATFARARSLRAQQHHGGRKTIA